MTIVFAVEVWKKAQPEVAKLIEAHWREVALNHKDVPLDPDWREYQRLADAGVLHTITARVNGFMVGYHLAMVTPHLHYASTRHLITDVYYISPPFRNGWTLLRLLKFVEKSARALNVKKLFTATKLHIDMGKVFERAGYTETERLYAKILRD